MISVCLTDPRASGGVFIIPHMLHAHAHSHVHVIVYVCVWMSVPIFLKPHGFFVFNTPFVRVASHSCCTASLGSLDTCEHEE